MVEATSGPAEDEPLDDGPHVAGLPAQSAEIARGYGLGTPVADLMLAARGEQGRVWRLDTTSGTFAVKELLLRQVERDAAADVAYQEAALAAGTLSMPQPIRTLSGHVLLEIAGHQVRAYTWVDLLPSDTGQDPVLVGETIAAVHRIQHLPAGPLLPWYTAPVGAARWAELLAAAEAVRAPFADAFRSEISVLLELEGLLEAPTSLQSCHRDLWADNLLPTANGGICVIDWENCGLEDPGQELPMVLLDFWGGDGDRAASLYGSYLAAGGPGRVRGRASFTMVIAQFGHFWENAVRDYVAPGATAATQEHSIERITEALQMSLRVHHLDEMLDHLAGVR
jgi:Ser/Thr protein kinase RdoA (MazF antagonist)